ncbi:MAG: ATP-dependent Clp protease ATP-binding subunit [Alphaproteobacteria bacterium]
MNFDQFNEKSKFLINESQNKAISLNNQQVLAEHFLASFFTNQDDFLKNILEYCKIKREHIIDIINFELNKIPNVTGDNLNIYFSNDFIKILDNCKNTRSEFNDSFISPEIILYTILKYDKLDITRKLNENNLNFENLKLAILKLRKGETIDDNTTSIESEVLKKFSTDLTELAKLGKLDPVIGREEEIRRSIQVLSRRTKNNPVLIGEPGVGKTAIAEGLALRIINNDIPDSLKNKKVISLDLGSIVAGAKFRGDFEERLKRILKEVEENKDFIILFIDEIHTLVGAGKSDGAMDASNLLKPALARGELHCIGATTLNEYRQNIEKDAALARRFQQIIVEEPSIEDSISILRGLKEKYEVHHGVKILDSAIVAAVELSKRYINDRFLPDKAIDLMDEAASRIRLQIDSKPEKLDKVERKLLQTKIEYESLKKENDKKSISRVEDLKKEINQLDKEFQKHEKNWNKEKELITNIQHLKLKIDGFKTSQNLLQREGKLSEAGKLAYSTIPELEKNLSELESQKDQKVLSKSVTSDEIAEIISKSTGIPLEKMLEGEKQKIINMEKELQSKVIGQEEAIKQISKSVLRSRAGIQDPNKPIGVFLFLGPTGVGKTQLTKVLSNFLFNNTQSLFRLDMSEYMEKHSVSKLIGSPPGYVGFEDGGILTERIRRKPYQLILLDEIEKAHSDIFNLLLQVFDDGRLTDSQGRVVNFKNTLIIMTSNIGAEFINFSEEQTSRIEIFTQEKIKDELKKNFKPEFLNRIDDLIIFNRLTKKEIVKIIDLQIHELGEILDNKKILITLDSKAKEWLLNEGFSTAYGARPLKRIIQAEIIDKIAYLIVSNKIGEECKLNVSANKNNELIINYD